MRYAIRTLARNPSFTLVIVGLLAIGGGASTVIFSAFDRILLRPLPVRSPEELVRMVQRIPQIGTRSAFPHAFYTALRERSTTLAAVFGETSLAVAMNEPAPAEVIQVRLPTPEFFDALGVQALHGRTLVSSDAEENLGDPPAVLSHSFWRRRFGGEPGAIGKALVLRGHRFSIVGVMPPAFNGIAVETSPDVRVPLRAYPLLASENQPMERNAAFELAGRLKPGLANSQALAESLSIWRPTIEAHYKNVFNLPREYIEAELRRGMELESLIRGVSILRERYGRALQLLLACAVSLLLLVCVNVAGLVIARSAGRRQEIAIRLAIGATRMRIIGHLLAESLLLTSAGAAGGLLIAAAFNPLLIRLLPPLRDVGMNPLTLTLQSALDWRIFLFSICISSLALLIFGLAPALRASQVSLDSALRTARASSRWGNRRILVVLQVAFCTLLVTGASLLVRTVHELHTMDPGFDSDRVITFTLNPALAGYSDTKVAELRDELARRAQRLPEVDSAATALIGVMRNSGMKSTAAPEGERISDAHFMNVSLNDVSIDYFRTMGVQILRGRGFSSADIPATRPVQVVVNQTLADRIFPNTDAVGKRFGIGAVGAVAGATHQIIGVVGDAKYRSLREPMTPTFYTLQRPAGFFQLVVRTKGNPQSVIEPLRREMAELDPDLPFSEIHNLSDEIAASTAVERLTALLASMFGIIASLLAAVGIYGLLGQFVIEKRQEIGIRMSLGANGSDIGWLIGMQSLTMVSGGILLGIGGTFLGGRWIRSLLYEVAPTDILSLSVAVTVVVFAAAIATAVPAIRASRVEPAKALRL